ncbi:MAG: TipAS antibiotic-recognition domain-containing protein [Gemmatimonadota bacterium]
MLDDPDHTLEATLDRQIDGLRGRIREEEELCRQLEVLRDRVRRDGDTVPLDILTRSLSGTVRMENHYSAAQLARLEDRREALGAQGMEAAQTRWAELLDEFTEALADGVPPEDARVQALVQRASSLLDAFTGGDPEIRESLARMYRREGPERVLEGRGMALAPGVWEYMARARAAHDT